MSTEPERRNRRSGVSGLAIAAGLFIGIGVGVLIDETAAGVLLGLGGGFVGMIVLRLVLGDW